MVKSFVQFLLCFLGGYIFQNLYSIGTLHDTVRLRPNLQELCLKSYGHAILDRLMDFSTSSYLRVLLSLSLMCILDFLPLGT